MTPDDLRIRTKKFAVDAIRVTKTAIPPDPIDNHIAQQLAEAASATASGYRAACRARTRADFICKLGNAIEEADESRETQSVT